MKIFSGKYGTRNVYMPGWIRPTQNVVRKAVFDLLGHDLSGLNYLELFSGSGAVGLEALSLGVQSALLVEKDPRCVAVTEENLQLLGVPRKAGEEGACEIWTMDAFAAVKLISQGQRRFDIVFADPPYGRGLPKKLLKTLGAYDILTPNCFVIVEHSLDDHVPEVEGRLTRVRHRRYGKSFLAVFEGSS